jgi:hypothetical protein
MENPRPADIILYPVTPRSGWTSRLVAAGEMILGSGKGAELYSHAALVSYSPGLQWEAKVPWVGLYRIDKTRTYEVWRLPGMTDEMREIILDEAKSHKGDWYNLIGLLTAGLLGPRNQEVCSQLVGICYAKAGIKIGKEGLLLLSPDAIADYPGARMIQRVIPPREKF